MLPKVDAEGRSKPYGGKQHFCEVCKSVNDTSHFKMKEINEMFNILKSPLDCNSNHVIYLNVSNVVALKLSLGTE